MQTRETNQSAAMFCYQCEMSAPSGCGASGQQMGTCGKDATLARLQDMMVFGAKGLSAYRAHAKELVPTPPRWTIRWPKRSISRSPT